MQHHTKLTLLSAMGMSVCVPFAAQAGDPGPMASYAPAPAPAASDCADPGWHLELAALYMDPGATEGNAEDDPDMDFGFRGSLGYELPSGLFFRTSYFNYDGELDGDGSDALEIVNWDFLIGDTICCSDNLAVEIAGGLRYGKFEEAGDADIDGFGPVLRIEAQRALTGPWSLYAGITQSFILGEDDEEEYDNSIYGITEIAAGVQYDFSMGGASDAYVRLGGEGQYYYGASDDDTQDAGLFGAALSVGFSF